MAMDKQTLAKEKQGMVRRIDRCYSAVNRRNIIGAVSVL